MLRTLGDNLPAGFVYQVAATPDGGRRFTHVSAGVERVLGVPPAEVLADAAAVYGLIDPADAPRVAAAEAAALAGVRPFACEFRVRTRAGAERWVHCRSAPRRLADGAWVWDGLLTDATDRKAAEAALAAADRRKDEFLAMLAHELRNPLAPLRASLHVLGATGSEDDRRRCLDIMARQVQTLDRLVADLLDLSRVRRGEVGLRRELVDLRDVLAEAAEASRPLVDQAGHALGLHLPGEPLAVDGDRVRLAQVFVNLLNNAAKYTGPGGAIEVRAERAGGEAVVRVRDTGAGIPADMLGRVFDLFVQVGGSRDRSQGGLGIGLALVRRLVELHGGTVEARSAGPGRGSAFVVRLPAARAFG